MTVFNYLHYQMINQLHSTLGAAILKSMQSLLGSTQTSHCVQLGPAAVPQLMVLKGSDNALLEGLSDHQERKKHKLSETRASHLQNGFLLVRTLWKVPVKDAVKPREDAPHGPGQTGCCLLPQLLLHGQLRQDLKGI